MSAIFHCGNEDSQNASNAHAEDASKEKRSTKQVSESRLLELLSSMQNSGNRYKRGIYKFGGMMCARDRGKCCLSLVLVVIILPLEDKWEHIAIEELRGREYRRRRSDLRQSLRNLPCDVKAVVRLSLSL